MKLYRENSPKLNLDWHYLYLLCLSVCVWLDRREERRCLWQWVTLSDLNIRDTAKIVEVHPPPIYYFSYFRHVFKPSAFDPFSELSFPRFGDVLICCCSSLLIIFLVFKYKLCCVVLSSELIGSRYVDIQTKQ